MGYWRPLDYSGELRGRPLRYLLVTMLADARRPMTVAELVQRCADEGVTFSGRPSKIISDALRWERRPGRVKRLRRGVYAYGRAPRTTMRWIHHRVEQSRAGLDLCVQQPPPRRSDTELWWVWKPNHWVPDWPIWPAPE